MNTLLRTAAHVSPDAVVKNSAPDADQIIVVIGDWEIIIGRDENHETHISVVDHDEGSETHYVLGKEGETQIC